MAISAVSADLLAQGLKNKKDKPEEANGFAQFLQAETAGGQEKRLTVNAPLAVPEGKSVGTGAEAASGGKSIWAHAQESHSDADIEEFLAFATMTPEEKIRYLMLKEMDLTEEELAAMDPAERAKIEKKIEEAIERKVREASGIPGEAGAAADVAAGVPV